jgi:hypothetical protein
VPVIDAVLICAITARAFNNKKDKTKTERKHRTRAGFFLTHNSPKSMSLTPETKTKKDQLGEHNIEVFRRLKEPADLLANAINFGKEKGRASDRTAFVQETRLLLAAIAELLRNVFRSV